MMLIRSKNLGMAAPMTMLPICSRRYCAGRVIYGDFYRYPQPNFTFVWRAVTSLQSGAPHPRSDFYDSVGELKRDAEMHTQYF